SFSFDFSHPPNEPSAATTVPRLIGRIFWTTDGYGPEKRALRSAPSSTDATNAGGRKAGLSSPTSQEVDPLIIQRQRRTVGLSRRAACPQTLDQLSCLTANWADDRASPLPATWKRPSQSKPATLPV